MNVTESGRTFLRPSHKYRIIPRPFPIALYTQTDAIPEYDFDIEVISSTHAGGIHHDDLRADIRSLYERTGLTWKEIAFLFNVSERMVHFWLTSKREMIEEKLDCLVGLTGLMAILDRGRPYKTRKFLRETFLNNAGLVALLRKGDFSSLRAWAGAQSRPPSEFHPAATSEALKASLPPSLVTLLAAVENPIVPPKQGKARIAKVGRVAKRRT